MHTGIIYRAVGPNGKAYIGKTINGLAGRKRQHYSNAFNKNHSAYNTKFYRAIRKHGITLFKWEILIKDVLEENLEENLDDNEKSNIKKFNSYKKGYNSTIGGEGVSGLRHTQEVKDRLSKLSSQRNSGSGNPRYGIKMSQELKDKISKAHIGKKLSEEHKRKIGLGSKGNIIPDEVRIKMAISSGAKEFCVFKLGGEYVGKWINQRKCARDLGICRTSIGKCLNKVRKSTNGYVFEYKESNNA